PAPIANWFLTHNKGNGSAADPDAVAFANDVLRTDPYSASGVAAQSAATGRYATTKEAAARLTMPALVLHGDEDHTVPYEAGQDRAKSLPNARFETMKGAGHNFFLAQRDHANKVVLDFLDQVDGK